MKSLKIRSWLFFCLYGYGQAAFADELQAIPGPVWLMFAIGCAALLLLLWSILAWRRWRKKLSAVPEDEAWLFADNNICSIRGRVFRIGRASDNDLCLDQDSVSTYHAELHRNDSGSYSVFDLDSTNGVWVNGQRVRRQTLKHGDQLAFGEIAVRFEQAEVSASQ